MNTEDNVIHFPSIGIKALWADVHKAAKVMKDTIEELKQKKLLPASAVEEKGDVTSTR
jgi:hypothetical protein